MNSGLQAFHLLGHPGILWKQAKEKGTLLEEKGQARRILVIDDEEDFLELIAFRFRKQGHLVMTAVNCEIGLNVIKSVPVDVVFLDMRMPHVDGVETLRRLRQIRPDLPVIIVTAHATDEMVQKATELRISGVYRKDVNFDDLHRIMEVALKKEAGPEKRPGGP